MMRMIWRKQMVSGRDFLCLYRHRNGEHVVRESDLFLIGRDLDRPGSGELVGDAGGHRHGTVQTHGTVEVQAWLDQHLA